MATIEACTPANMTMMMDYFLGHCLLPSCPGWPPSPVLTRPVSLLHPRHGIRVDIISPTSPARSHSPDRLSPLHGLHRFTPSSRPAIVRHVALRPPADDSLDTRSLILHALVLHARYLLLGCSRPSSAIHLPATCPAPAFTALVPCNIL